MVPIILVNAPLEALSGILIRICNSFFSTASVGKLSFHTLKEYSKSLLAGSVGALRELCFDDDTMCRHVSKSPLLPINRNDNYAKEVKNRQPVNYPENITYERPGKIEWFQSRFVNDSNVDNLFAKSLSRRRFKICKVEQPEKPED
jgi:hypothetical protein